MNLTCEVSGPDLAPPLAAVLRRIAARSSRWDVQIGLDGDGWWTAAAVREGLDELMAGIGAAFGTDDPAVTGTFLLNGYVRTLAGAALVALATERRVPDISPDNVVFGLGEDGMVRRLALATPRFAALPGDPAAEHPHVTVLPDAAALRIWLRDRLVQGHLCELTSALQVRTRRGPRAVWGIASDMCSGVLAGLVAIEGTLEAAERLDGEAQAFLATGVPLIATPPLCPIAHEGRLAVGWRRVTCCLSYRLGDSDLCTSCPWVTPEERAQRLRVKLEALPEH